MQRHNVFYLAGLLAVGLGFVGLGPVSSAEAGEARLDANYRGPADAKAGDTSSSDATTDSDADTDTDSGPSSGDSSDESGGIGEGGGGEGGGGEGGGEGGASEGGGEGGGESEGGGSDIGGGGSTSEGSSAGGASESGGSTSTGAPGGGGSGFGGKSSAAAQNERFELVSWFFEHNRESYVFDVARARNSRVRLPEYSSVGILGVLSRDERTRSPVTPEDRERIFDILKSATIDKQDVVRDTAVIALGKLGTEKAVDVLLERLEAEPRTEIKQDTLLALGLSRSPKAIDPLIAALGSKNMTEYALYGLGLTGDLEKAAPAVLAYFEKHVSRKGHVEDVAAAAIALGALQDGDAVDQLAKALKGKKTDPVVRTYCAHALGQIGGEDAMKALLRAVEKPQDKESARGALLALGRFPDKGVLKTLTGKDGIGDNSDPLAAGFAAISAARVLDGLPESEWKKSPDDIRDVALAPNKSKIKAQYANLALAMFSGGIDNEVRRFYTEELGQAKLDPNTLSALAMAAGMSNLGAVEPMLDEIAGSVSRDPKLGSYAAMSLGMLDGNPVEQAKRLRKIYSDVDRDDVRRGAVLALGLVGDRRDVSFLTKVIEQEQTSWLGRYTRGVAVVALGLIRDGESVPAIQKLMRSPDATTRALAVAALGYLGDKDPSPRIPAIASPNNFRLEFPSLKVLLGHL